jgi:hypothetical protein
MSQAFWVKTATKIQGPFTPAQLRRLAASGQLHREHLISADRQKWSRAENVKGLEFPADSDAIDLRQSAPPTAPETPGLAKHASDVGEREAVGSDVPLPVSGDGFEDDDEYRLADLAARDDPWADALPDTPAIRPPYPPPSNAGTHYPSAVAGRMSSVYLRDKQKGAAIGATTIFVTLLFGCIVGGIAMGALTETSDVAAGAVGVLTLLFWACGIGGGVCAMLGTGTTVSVREESPGILAVIVQKRIAFFPAGESHAHARSEGSMLVVRSEFLGGGSSKGTVDAIWIVIVICLCMAGAIPGLIFWFAWLSARNRADEASNSKVTLELCGGPGLKPVPLVSVVAKDFTSLRMDCPPEIDRVVKLITNRIPIRVIEA